MSRKKYKKLFISSSVELEADVEEFIACINNFNLSLSKRYMGIEARSWRDLPCAIHGKRTQDDYNAEITSSDIVVVLIHTQIGSYTKEEYRVAVASYARRKCPRLYLYFKEEGETDEEIAAFKSKLREDEVFYGTYKNYADLRNKFGKELGILVENGFFGKIRPSLREVIYLFFKSVAIPAVVFLLLCLIYFLCSDHRMTVSLKEARANGQLPVGDSVQLVVNGENVPITDLREKKVFTVAGKDYFKKLEISFQGGAFFNEQNWSLDYRKQVELVVHRKDSAWGAIYGRVKNGKTAAPLDSARVRIKRKYVAYTDAYGEFNLFIPLEEQEVYYPVSITKKGYKPYESVGDCLAGGESIYELEPEKE